MILIFRYLHFDNLIIFNLSTSGINNSWQLKKAQQTQYHWISFSNRIFFYQVIILPNYHNFSCNFIRFWKPAHQTTFEQVVFVKICRWIALVLFKFSFLYQEGFLFHKGWYRISILSEIPFNMTLRKSYSVH